MLKHDDWQELKAQAKAHYGDLPGVEGFGIGDGTLRVYLKNHEAASQLPDEFEGVPVERVITGDIVAQNGLP